MFSIWLALIRTSKGLLGNSLHWLKKLERNVFWLRWPCRQPASPALNNQLWSVRLLEASVSLRLMIHTAPPFQRERETKWLLSGPEGEPKILTVNWKLRQRLNGKILFYASRLNHFNLDIMSVSFGTVLWSNVDVTKQHVWVMFQSKIKRTK